MSVIIDLMAKQIKKNLGVIKRRRGMEFRVWAPFAKQVSLALPYVSYDTSNARPMNSEGDGYWSILAEDAEVGQVYKYLVDTGKEMLVRNDPRGRALTTSNGGDSILTTSKFDWTDENFTPKPLNQQVIYEMHIGTFNRRDPATQGTFHDAIEKLDYLKGLGITTIELMPVTSMLNSYGWGYNTISAYTVESSYGGRRGLMEFVNACHERDIAVVLDLVYNHFSGGNDLWQFDGWNENGRGGIYFYNDERGDTPWGSRPDYGRPEVRQYILDNITMWLTEYHVDGFRLDSTIYMRNTAGNDDPTTSIPDAWPLLQAISKLTKRIKPNAILIAEDNSSTSAIVDPVSIGGCGFDAQWQLNLVHTLKSQLDLPTAYSGDLMAELSTQYGDSPFRRVIFSDSHDTAANGGARINTAADPEQPASKIAKQKTLIANAATLLLNGTPMLLQGVEFLQSGDFNDWNGLEWENVEKHAGFVDAHRHLIALRLNHYGDSAGLAGASQAVIHYNPADRIVVLHRWDRGGPGDDTVVVLNFGDKEFRTYEIVMPHDGAWLNRFNSAWKGYSDDFREAQIQEIFTRDNREVSIHIAPYAAYIFTLR